MSRRCKRSKPYNDFVKNAVMDKSGNFAESEKYFYSPDGLHRMKKTGQMQDAGRRKVLQSDNDEERNIWMKKWNMR